MRAIWWHVRAVRPVSGPSVPGTRPGMTGAGTDVAPDDRRGQDDSDRR